MTRARPWRVMLVAGARPNFMKVAPLWRAFSARKDCQCLFVHTGQHYDDDMSEVFLQELGLPEPDHRLAVGGGGHTSQTARTMLAFEPVLDATAPDCVVVVGDVNATLACALVAAKRGVPVAHVEAGLRCGDGAMPEEINRRLTDCLCDWLFATEPEAIANLAREGLPASRIFLVGHVMVDNLLHELRRLDAQEASAGPTLVPPLAPRYGVVTLHRAATVDAPRKLAGVLEALQAIARDLPLYFPVHPRTRARLPAAFLAAPGNVTLMPPLGYRSFLGLWRRADCVLTDSGGLQEETTALGVPCLTLRDTTERPITLASGSNRLAGTARDSILAAWRALRSATTGPQPRPPLWDGEAAQRIASLVVAGMTTRSGRSLAA